MRTHSHFRILLPTLLLGVLATCSGDAAEVGQKQAEIGKGVTPTNVSSAAAVILYKNSELQDPFCTGTHLDSGEVLTAAHCLQGKRTQAINESFGSALRINAVASLIRQENEEPELVIAGNYLDTETHKTKGFVAFDGDDLGASPIKGLADDVGVEAIVTAQGNVYAAGWTRTGVAGRKAALFEVPVALFDGIASFDGHNATAISETVNLGAGTAKAIIEYEVNKLAVVVEKRVKGDLVSTVLGVDLGTGAKELIMPSRLNYSISTLAVLPDLTIVIGGTNVGLRRPLLVTSMKVAGAWLNADAYLSTSIGSLLDMVATNDGVVTLVGGYRIAPKVSRWRVQGSSPVVFRYDFSFPVEQLKENFTLNDSWNAKTQFEPTSLAISGNGVGATVYVAGIANVDNKPVGMTLRLTESLSVDRSFAMRGVDLSEDSYTRFGPMFATGSRLYVLAHSKDSRGMGKSTTLLWDSTKHSVYAGSTQLDDWSFARNIDLALASPHTLEPGGVTEFGDIIPGQPLQCIGQGGSGVLQEGVFLPHPFAPTDEYVEVESETSVVIGGDSGGPCFGENGELVGVIVSGDDQLPAGGTPDPTIVSGNAITVFLLEMGII